MKKYAYNIINEIGIALEPAIIGIVILIAIYIFWCIFLLWFNVKIPSNVEKSFSFDYYDYKSNDELEELDETNEAGQINNHEKK